MATMTVKITTFSNNTNNNKRVTPRKQRHSNCKTSLRPRPTDAKNLCSEKPTDLPCEIRRCKGKAGMSQDSTSCKSNVAAD